MDHVLIQLLGLAVGGAIVARAKIAAWLAERGESVQTTDQQPEHAEPRRLDGVHARTRAIIADGRRLLLVGAPGSGKSTAARVLVRSFMAAGAQVVIIDPDGAAWPRGCKMVGAPDDWPAIDAELKRIASLATQRRAAYQRGCRTFDPLLILIDEAPMVLRSCDDALAIVSDLARRGRKLAMSVMLLSQDTQSRTLGLEGQTKLLEAFERFDCRMAADGVAMYAGDELRKVLPTDHGATDLVLPLGDDDQFLESALLSGTGSAGSRGGILVDKVVPEPEPVPLVPVVPDLVPAGSNAVPAAFDDETIRALIAAGWSRNKIAEKIGGRRIDALARIRMALNEAPTEHPPTAQHSGM
jgi:hypothetical protein